MKTLRLKLLFIFFVMPIGLIVFIGYFFIKQFGWQITGFGLEKLSFKQALKKVWYDDVKLEWGRINKGLV